MRDWDRIWPVSCSGRVAIVAIIDVVTRAVDRQWGEA
jgi:phosphopantothenate synthetase